MFEPLWRGGEARATRPRDGAGLGLPISRSIVEAHGGRIYVAETSSRGTQIRFMLPRLAPADADERAALRQREDMDQQDAVTPGEHIGGITRRPPDADENRVVASASLNDSRRLAELRALEILDTTPEPDYDDLAALAAAVCRSPVAAVNFVDDERHFTKAIFGMPDARGSSVANSLSFCAATVQAADGVLVVPDPEADERWRDHPLVTGGPKVGFYAGVSIITRGERVGVVCVCGGEPREVSDQERTALATLARQAAEHLELRRRNAELHRLAVSDPLTGLANRTMLLDRLDRALAERDRTGGEVPPGR